MKLWIPGQTEPKKVLFDSSALFGTGREQINHIQSTYVELSKVRIFDSPTNMFEIIHHFQDNKEAMLRNIQNLAILSKNNAFPSISTVVINDISYYVHNERNKEEIMEEVAKFLSLRKRIINEDPYVEEEIKALIVNEVTEGRDGYVQDILSLRQRFTDRDVDGTLGSNEYKNEMFPILMDRFSVPDTLRALIALHKEWLSVPSLRIFHIYYTAKIKQYRRHWTDQTWPGPPPSDFIDLDFATYIPQLDIFVTNNRRDFQDLFQDEEIISKIKTKKEFINGEW